jgi:putative flippase GtrA
MKLDAGPAAAPETSPPGVQRSVALYLVSGLTSAICNLATRHVLSLFMPFEAAVTLAYLVGMFIAFVMMKRFAFPGSERSLSSQATGFIIVNLFGLVQTVVASSLVLRYLMPLLPLTRHQEIASHFIGLLLPAVTSYFGHKHLSFRK